MITVGLLFFVPLKIQMSFQVEQQVEGSVQIKFLFIPVYMKEITLDYEEIFDQLTKLTTKKSAKLNNRSRSMISALTCKKLSWTTVIGTANAAHTAPIAALAYSCKAIIASFFIERWSTKPERVNYHVTPCYQGLYVKSDCQCMFSVKLGHAIGILLNRERSKQNDASTASD